MKDRKQKMLVVAASLLLAGVANAAIVMSWEANGTDYPSNQGWSFYTNTGDDPLTRSLVNETFGSGTYDAMRMQATAVTSPYQRGGYLLLDNSIESDLKAGGYKVTYVSRTMDAPVTSYHRMRFRDRTTYFDLHFVKNSSGTDGLVLDTEGAGTTLVKAMDLADDYHTVEMVVTPTTLGSFSATDTVQIFVDGALEYTAARSVAGAGSSTYAVRAEFAKDGQNAADFAVSKYTVETIPEPATLGLFAGAFGLMFFMRRRLLI